MFVFKIFVHVCQIMQEIKDPRLGHSLYFFLFEVIAVGAKKKEKKGQKYIKDGYGDMHSQTSLYSRNVEISLCPQEDIT